MKNLPSPNNHPPPLIRKFRSDNPDVQRKTRVAKRPKQSYTCPWENCHDKTKLNNHLTNVHQGRRPEDDNDEGINFDDDDAPLDSGDSDSDQSVLDLSFDNASDADAEDTDDNSDDPMYRGLHQFATMPDTSVNSGPQVDDAPTVIDQWHTETSGTAPFRDLQSMLLLALVHGDEDILSERLLGKVVYAMSLMIKIKEDCTANGKTFKMPAVDYITDFHSRQRNEIPEFETTAEIVNIMTSEGTSTNFPSINLRSLVGNKSKCNKISALPDLAIDKSLGLQYGDKWKHERLFQHPVIRHNDTDYWVGDSVYHSGSCAPFLISSFFADDGEKMASGHSFDFLVNDGDFGIDETATVVKVGTISRHAVDLATTVIPKKMIGRHGYAQPLSDTLKRLTKPHPMNKIIPGTLHHYPVKVAPIILFTDDTTQNSSKQYNKLGSWSMTCAAMTMEERNRRENIKFIGAVAGSDGLDAMAMIPGLMKDLKKLEQGVVMYSLKHQGPAIVVAPLLCITADNPRHADLCGIKHSTTKFPCRKCYYKKPQKKMNTTTDITLCNQHRLLHAWPKRTKSHYSTSRDDPAGILDGISSIDVDQQPHNHLNNPQLPTKNDTIIINGTSGNTVQAKVVSFRPTGSSLLLDLESFDPAKDTPVEILHSILLGIANYLVTHLIKITIAHDQSQKNRLKRTLKRYVGTRACKRHFRCEINHCGSFLGRDFKQLVQVLPIIFVTEFTQPNDGNVATITNAFTPLGLLSSLVFVRAIESSYESYIL
ncbi:unnamed protein product [Absidia cylindrospora]